MFKFNTNAFLYIILFAGGVAAILGVAQIWFNALPWEIFTKAMITILVTSVIASYLMAVDYEAPSGANKKLLMASVFLAVIIGTLSIAQMWLLFMEWMLFSKAVGTLAIIFGLIAFIMAVKEDFGSNKKLRDENYLD